MIKNRKSIKNILITCAGGSSSVYFARKMKKKYKIFLADATDQTIAKYLGLPFSKIPFGNAPNYCKSINSLVKRWSIDCIVPGADEELLPISKFVKSHNILGVIPSEKFISLCLNKKQLMYKLNEYKISSLLPFEVIKDIKYPVIAKPIYGRGSRQVHLINNPVQLKGYLNLYEKKFDDVLFQRFIKKTEYTVSVVVNNLNQLIGVIPKRVVLKKGITKIAVTEKNDLINEVAKKIVKKMQPAGPFNIQLKIYNGKVYIFEINPRLSTTSVLTDRSFGNEIELYIRSYSRAITPPRFKEGIYLFRYDENYFHYI